MERFHFQRELETLKERLLAMGADVEAAERDGKPAVWVSCDEVEKLPDDAPHVFWARPGTSLKIVMLAMHRSQTSPVALFDDQSRFVGAIGIRDVLSAVLRR